MPAPTLRMPSISSPHPIALDRGRLNSRVAKVICWDSGRLFILFFALLLPGDIADKKHSYLI